MGPRGLGRKQAKEKNLGEIVDVRKDCLGSTALLSHTCRACQVGGGQWRGERRRSASRLSKQHVLGR